MQKTKMLAGAGGGLVLLAAAGMAIAQQDHRPGADLNGDGQISVQEIEISARTRFAELDANKDGKLTGDELPRRHGRHGRHQRGEGAPPPPPPAAQPDLPGQPQAGQIAQSGQPVPPPPSGRPRMDANGDGAVTLTEFYQQMRQRLLRADTNGDGNLSAEELTSARQHRRGRGGDRD